MDPNQFPGLAKQKEYALYAGKLIFDNFRFGPKHVFKEDKTPLSETDDEINEFVLKSMREYPDINVISEEGNDEVPDADYMVLCDPIDGTFPFCWGVPVCTFAFSVLYKGKPIAATIYDPFGKRLWQAEKGKGAFMTDMVSEECTQIHVSEHDAITGAVCNIIHWKNATYNLRGLADEWIDQGGRLTNPTSVAIFGGLIGMGTVQASIFPGANAWETSAMQLIVEEAGGAATDLFGNPLEYPADGSLKGHIISNGKFHGELVKIVRTFL